MRKQVPAWQVGDRFFPTIQEAMKAELTALFEPWEQTASDSPQKAAAWAVVEHADEVVSILTGKEPKAPRKPRKDRGTKRNPKDKNTPTLVTT